MTEETPQSEALAALLAQARAEFGSDKQADRDNREAAYDDIRFIALPEEQWLAHDRKERGDAGRALPTLNRLQPFLKYVANEIRLNKPGINVRPAESDDAEAADIIEGLIRHIETQSDAPTIYANWALDMVKCGIGHMRLTIEPSRANPAQMALRQHYVEDPLSVIWDRSAVKSDRSDARRCFVVDYMPRDVIDQTYGEALGDWPDAEEASAWTEWMDSSTNEVRVCELYRAVMVDEYAYRLNGAPGIAANKKDIPKGGVLEAHTKRPEIRMWILTAGKVLEGGLEGIRFPGRRIPIFPAIADETRIGRTVVRKGMVRDTKDSVRLLNWAMALLIETMAASPRPKWVGPAKAFTGLEAEWDDAANPAKSYLPYNDNARTPPVYVDPPRVNATLVQAMQVFDDNIKQVTGIYDAALGARSNEVSGVAIDSRQRQGHMATFDYIDNFIAALRSLGRALVDIIPEVYDGERTVRILGREDKEKILILNQFDPASGSIINKVETSVYDVIVDSGPSFGTRRQEAAASMEKLIAAMPSAAPIIVDSLVKLQDWPGAEKLVARLQTMLPPQVQAMEGLIPEAAPDAGIAPPFVDPETEARTEKIRQEAQSIALGNLVRRQEMGLV